MLTGDSVCLFVCVRVCTRRSFFFFPGALNASVFINMAVRLAKSQIRGDVFLCRPNATCFLSRMTKKGGASHTTRTKLMQNTCDKGLFLFFFKY